MTSLSGSHKTRRLKKLYYNVETKARQEVRYMCMCSVALSVKTYLYQYQNWPQELARKDFPTGGYAYLTL